MKKTLAILTVTTLTLLLLGACRSPQLYTFTAADAGKIINARVGDRIQIALESNPSTGYTWVYANPVDATKIIPTGEFVKKEKTDEGICGAPSMHNFFYKIIAPGECGINLEYIRPWLKNQTPENRFSLLVKATGKAENPPPAQNKKTMKITDSKENTLEVKDSLLQ